MTRPMTRKFITMLAAVSGLAIAAPAQAQGACDREFLQGMADSWVAAIEGGTMMTMNLGEWVDYEENFRRASLGGFLDQPRHVDWHRSLLDTTSCKVFVEAVILDEAHPMVLATQIANGFFGTGPFKNIVTDEGDWLFDARATYNYARAEDWGEIPEAERSTRAELIAAADAYLNLFADKSVTVPWGTPCARLEGGIYTGRGEPTDSCNVGVPENIQLTDRQYIVDEVHGAVNVFLKFGTGARPDSHTFRVENGQLRFIHTTTNCGDQVNCGFPPLAEMRAGNPAMRAPAGD